MVQSQPLTSTLRLYGTDSLKGIGGPFHAPTFRASTKFGQCQISHGIPGHMRMLVHRLASNHSNSGYMHAWVYINKPVNATHGDRWKWEQCNRGLLSLFSSFILAKYAIFAWIVIMCQCACFDCGRQDSCSSRQMAEMCVIHLECMHLSSTIILMHRCSRWSGGHVLSSMVAQAHRHLITFLPGDRNGKRMS